MANRARAAGRAKPLPRRRGSGAPSPTSMKSSVPAVGRAAARSNSARCPVSRSGGSREGDHASAARRRPGRRSASIDRVVGRRRRQASAARRAASCRAPRTCRGSRRRTPAAAAARLALAVVDAAQCARTAGPPRAAACARCGSRPAGVDWPPRGGSGRLVRWAVKNDIVLRRPRRPAATAAGRRCSAGSARACGCRRGTGRRRRRRCRRRRRRPGRCRRP